MSRLVVANWKLHGRFASNEAYFHALAQNLKEMALGVSICVPFPYLAQAQAALQASTITWGAQNVSKYLQGAYTGEVSASMLEDFGCQYVLVGHSERRALFAETDLQVEEKLMALAQTNVTPILCVGESEHARQHGEHLKVIEAQLALLARLPQSLRSRLLVAYEPVWAIGSGRVPTVKEIEEVFIVIHQNLLRFEITEGMVLYGGSVKAGNVLELSSVSGLSGFLVGGASLDAKEFSKICYAVAQNRGMM